MPGASYLPSYFQITKPTQLPLDNLALLPPFEQGLYYHEYLHFVINVSTTFGLSKTWNTFDRIRQLIHFVQHQEQEVAIPLQNAVVDEQRQYFTFLNSLLGSKSVDAPPDVQQGYSISAITLTEDPIGQQLMEGFDVRHIDLTLSNPGFVNQFYRFGVIAIEESMVYLAERKFYDIQSGQTFPYNAANIFASYINPTIGTNPELLYALCAISLMHPLPGFAFYKLLEDFNQTQFIPETSRQLLQRGNELYSALGWHISEAIIQAGNGIQHIAEQFYQHEFFTDTLSWFLAIINRGMQIHHYRPNFLLEIFENPNALGGIAPYFQLLGGPHCINAAGDRYMTMPAGLEELANLVHPQHLLVLDQLQKLLLVGTRQCSLLNICSTSNNKELVDERCENNPWDRVNDEMGCPFAATWALYGLDQRHFVLDGAPLTPA